MKKVKIGIVCEGPSDLVVIKTLLSNHLREEFGETVLLEFDDMQPYIDNTSGSGYSQGGWLMVYKWCLNHPSEVREAFFASKGIFADDMDSFNVSGILVHMDSDICSDIGDRAPDVVAPTVACNPTIRGQFICSVLRSWLWKEGENTDPRYILCPAVESTEAWLVAGLCPDISPETNHDIQRRLAILDYEVVKKKIPPKNILTPNKKRSNYEKISLKAAENIDEIAKKCLHFKNASASVREIILATKP